MDRTVFRSTNFCKLTYEKDTYVKRWYYISIFNTVWLIHSCDHYRFILQCKNGSISTHRLVLASISPFVKEILENGDPFGSDDIPTIFLPDIQKEEMMFLLSILYNGSLNMYKRYEKINIFYNLIPTLVLQSFKMSFSNYTFTVQKYFLFIVVSWVV